MNVYSAFVQQLINGVSIGFVYALIALGYTMVYGVLRMINFAHGQLFTIGPMVILTLLEMTHLTDHFHRLIVPLSPAQAFLVLVLAIVVGGAAAGVVGLITERVAYRPLRKASSMAMILAALGLSIFMQNATMLIFGAETKGFPKLLPTARFRVFGAIVSGSQVVIAAITVVLLAALFYFVNRTYWGRSMRAVAEDKEAASLMGANPTQAIALIFLIGPALGGASGVLYSMQYQRAIYSMGNVIGMKGWIVSILGGIGNLKGAVVAGLLLGIVETFITGYLPVVTGGALGTEYRDVFAFLLLILMLFVRPQGLFGETVQAK